MRHGVHFALRHPHERAHLEPLRKRLLDLEVDGAGEAGVVVDSDTRPPERGAWNVQVFHGLGDKGYTLNPLFLQRGRFPRLRTAANMAMAAVGLPGPFLRPPERPGRRRSRYEQVNAYGPRFADRLEAMLRDVHISRHGHPALNDLGRIRTDRDGPLLWLPTWDNRRFLGGDPQSSLAPFAHEVALVSRHVPVRIKYHPLTIAHRQDAAARRELEAEPGVEVVPSATDPYELLEGVRGVLTDTSSLSFEAYCMGVPVGLARPSSRPYRGMHAELAERVPVLSSGRPDLLQWAEAPDRERDGAWVRDLLYAPSPRRNDAFAQELRQHAEATSGGRPGVVTPAPEPAGALMRGGPAPPLDVRRGSGHDAPRRDAAPGPAAPAPPSRQPVDPSRRRP